MSVVPIFSSVSLLSIQAKASHSLPCPNYITAATAVANDVVSLLMSLLS